jgi:hypothetical protein
MAITIRISLDFVAPPAGATVSGFNPITGAPAEIEFPFGKGAEVSAWLRRVADAVDEETKPFERRPAIIRPARSRRN